jgi:hypothetical protein
MKARISGRIREDEAVQRIIRTSISGLLLPRRVLAWDIGG